MVLSDIKFIVAKFWCNVISTLMYYVTYTVSKLLFNSIYNINMYDYDDMKCHAYDCHANALRNTGVLQTSASATSSAFDDMET
jgi:hypothetical protein